jgi:hypothetical protein
VRITATNCNRIGRLRSLPDRTLVCLYFSLVLATSTVAQGVLDECAITGNAKSPNQRWSAHFRQTAPEAAHGNRGEVTIYHDGRKRLTHELPRLVASAAWSPDSKFCVFTTVNAGGHSPSFFTAYVFSLAHHTFRRVDDIVGDVSNPDFKFEAPDIVLFDILDRDRQVGETKQARTSLHKIFAICSRDDQM